MDWISHSFSFGNRLLAIDWPLGTTVGWLGNCIFFSRFMVQWYATEKKKQVVVPASFWWLSLAGALLLFSYAVYQRDAVFIFAYAFTWIPYVRNLMIHRKHQQATRHCTACSEENPPQARFCLHCGCALAPAVSSA
jgi:lipid-A-disaccharide synthase-like uncharacterized protein